MAKITRDSLMTLEAYAKARNDFRAKTIAHKKVRTVHLGDHITLIFEDEQTMRYQVQEMLRAEKIFEDEGIQEEMDAYNPLIPDGSNWKATMMIEYDNEAERKVMLSKLIGVEVKVWAKVDDMEKVYPIADEDLERETEEKTSAVHFLRFELSQEMIKALKNGAKLAMGVDHAAYQTAMELSPEVRSALVADFS
ncbi:DUF3501 family protein [Sulfurirhabdus autotrophica]|uniref:Uncharacterized protein DUF3501 n=1 Tax=Sulfurirhabdus autotrophica TaxID=1706046 RepID=A0A4R3YDB3_9PROT|nr:DUF3501 family protein [Sulfurirhabdus autotrophica]TCV89088.1 uncharacterized protein DUF3501 [Sulfurirhabdus autotrophica]